MKMVYLNGNFVSQEAAVLPVTDRGFLFGDGVYEVIPVYNGKPYQLSAHIKRLQQSLGYVRIENPYEELGWVTRIRETIQRNDCGDCSLYLQVTRGTPEQPRDHAFPQRVSPSVLIMTQPLATIAESVLEQGLKAVLLEDIRWSRCDIKSVALLGNVMLRQAAIDLGASEAILQRDGYLTEGAASNVFVVQSGEVMTPPLSQEILPGITREIVILLLRKLGYSLRETRIPVTMMKTADEIWLSSSTKTVLPVTTLDSRKINRGEPGPVWKAVFNAYQEEITLFSGINEKAKPAVGA